MSNILPDYENIFVGPWDESDPKDTGVISYEPLHTNTPQKTSDGADLDDFIPTVAHHLPIKNAMNGKKQNMDVEKEIDNISVTELSKKYKGEYSSWSNMKQRCKKGYELHPDFADFTSFLIHMGPKPEGSYTLDRRDTLNPEYSPENCRWASKKLQTANRKNTVTLTDANGVTKTLAQWAIDKDTSMDTMRSRRHRGWSDHEVIYGRKKGRPSNSPGKGKAHADWSGVANPNAAEPLYQRHSKPNEDRRSWLIRHCYARMDHYRCRCIEIDSEGRDVPEDLNQGYLEWKDRLHEKLNRITKKYSPSFAEILLDHAKQYQPLYYPAKTPPRKYNYDTDDISGENDGGELDDYKSQLGV